jgi:hypothetical protein
MKLNFHQTMKWSHSSTPTTKTTALLNVFALFMALKFESPTLQRKIFKEKHGVEKRSRTH